MSTETAQTGLVIVSSLPNLLLLLDTLVNLPVDPPFLFFDLESARLGRLGSLSLLLLYVAPRSTIYIIDVSNLGSETFSIPNNHGASFKTILESAGIPKVFFDIRNDSDALYSHYDISVNAVVDIQILEFAKNQLHRAFEIMSSLGRRKTFRHVS